jgi:polyhydroxybutyrate depolymerase
MWPVVGGRTLAIAAALVALVSALDLPAACLVVPSVALAAPPGPLSAVLAVEDAPSPPAGAVAALDTVSAGGLERSYQLLRPAHPAAPRIPAIVFLHGGDADLATEETRDGLLPLVVAGEVVLAYPVGYDETWNAGRCCGDAERENVDDVGFVAAVAAQLAADPGVDPDRISLAGYSNGGKMALRVACELPGPFATVVVLLGVPMSPCPSSGPPVSLLQVAVHDDPESPYEPGDAPFEADGVLLTPTTSEAAFWHSRDGCIPPPSQQEIGHLTIERWSQCQGGSRFELATYAAGGHLWPTGDSTTPPAGQVLWDFVSGEA